MTATSKVLRTTERLFKKRDVGSHKDSLNSAHHRQAFKPERAIHGIAETGEPRQRFSIKRKLFTRQAQRFIVFRLYQPTGGRASFKNVPRRHNADAPETALRSLPVIGTVSPNSTPRSPRYRCTSLRSVCTLTIQTLGFAHRRFSESPNQGSHARAPQLQAPVLNRDQYIGS